MSEKTVRLSEVPAGNGVRIDGVEWPLVRGRWLNHGMIEVVYPGHEGVIGTPTAFSCATAVTDLGPPRFGPSEADDLVAKFGGEIGNLSPILYQAREYVKYADKEYPELAERANAHLIAFARLAFSACREPDPPPPREEPEESRKDAGGRGASTGETVHFKFKCGQNVQLVAGAFSPPLMTRAVYIVQELRATKDGNLMGINHGANQINFYAEDKLELCEEQNEPRGDDRSTENR